GELDTVRRGEDHVGGDCLSGGDVFPEVVPCHGFLGMFIVEELLPVGTECGAAVDIEHLVGVTLVGHVQTVDVVFLPGGWGGVAAHAVGDGGVGVGHLAIDPELSHGGGHTVVGRGRNILGGGLLTVVLPRGIGVFRGCL